MKTTRAILAALAAFAIPAANADITTGWLPTAQGTYSFLDAANWANGETNGVFSADWTPAGWQVFNLSEDWTGSLSFYGNITKDLTFNGSGGTRTIYLNDDFVIRPSASSGKIVFDTTVNLDLGGGERVFSLASPSSADKFRFNGVMTNGNVIIEGNAGISLFNAASISGNVKVGENSTLTINYANNNHTVKRANDIGLHRGTLSVSAYSGDDTAQFGNLTVSGASVPGVSVVTIAHNNHVSTLEAKSLTVNHGGTLAILGDDLAAEGSKANRILFETPPMPSETFSKAESPSAYVLEGVVMTVGGNNVLPTKDAANTAYSSMPTLATYDEVSGVRALSSSETSTAISATEAVNLIVPSAGTINLSGDAVVNSLQMQANAYNSSPASITGEGTLTIESGMILAIAPKDGALIDVPVNFGATMGYVVVGGALKGTYEIKLKKPVSGTGGLVLTKISATGYDHRVEASSSGRAVTASEAVGNTYTGDTYVQCIVDVGSSDFLPHGERSGNTIVNGSLKFGTISINGLYGTGLVKGTTLTVGEDGSDSHFSGTAALTSALNVKAGSVILDGSVTQGAVNVAAGAAIGGDGSVAGGVAFAEGAKLAVDVVDGAAPSLSVAGAVTGGPVTVDASIAGSKWTEPQCVLRSESAISATFVKGANVGTLELRENGTELWAGPVLARPTIISMH